VWDQSIRKQIKTCAFFVPVTSRHTHERREGYFRLECRAGVAPLAAQSAGAAGMATGDVRKGLLAVVVAPF
jgi:hypothetical protein